MKLDDEVDTKTVRGMLVEKLITAACYSVCALILWALSTSYKLDTLISNESTDRKIALTNANNETVTREADMLKRINVLEDEVKALKLAAAKPHTVPTFPVTPPDSITFPEPRPNPSLNPGPHLNVQQSPIDYERLYRKEFKK